MVTHIEKQWKTGGVIQVVYSMHSSTRKKDVWVFWQCDCHASFKESSSLATKLACREIDIEWLKRLAMNQYVHLSSLPSKQSSPDI